MPHKTKHLALILFMRSLSRKKFPQKKNKKILPKFKNWATKTYWLLRKQVGYGQPKS